MDSPIVRIEIGRCRFDASCEARDCTAKASWVARAFDARGWPNGQYALCRSHSQYVAQREFKKGREVLFRPD
jgi:hypothetical protein